MLGREEPGRALTIGNVLVPNPGGARAGSATGSITSITPPRPASAVHEAEALLADWGFRQTREGWGAQGPASPSRVARIAVLANVALPGL